MDKETVTAFIKSESPEGLSLRANVDSWAMPSLHDGLDGVALGQRAIRDREVRFGPLGGFNADVVLVLSEQPAIEFVRVGVLQPLAGCSTDRLIDSLVPTSSGTSTPTTKW